MLKNLAFYLLLTLANYEAPAVSVPRTFEPQPPVVEETPYEGAADCACYDVIVNGKRKTVCNSACPGS